MKTMEWGMLIVNYLYLGGLSAGLFFISSLATFLLKPGEPVDSGHMRIARWGALLAPWPVAIGCTLLIFDLGKWYRFYKLFVHFRWTSPMSIGSWLLVLFSLVSMLNCYAWLKAAHREKLFAKLPSFLRSYNYDLDHWRRRLAFAGLPISAGVGIYTGVLLGAVQSRPFWNTNLVAQMFLISALSTGCATLILALALNSNDMTLAEFRFLYGLDIAFMSLEFFIVVPYLLHGELSVQAVQDSLQLILGGPFTVVFWVCFLGFGLLVPLAMEVKELGPVVVTKVPFHYNRRFAGAASVLVLMGGFMLRYVFVYAGQMSVFK